MDRLYLLCSTHPSMFLSTLWSAPKSIRTLPHRILNQAKAFAEIVGRFLQRGTTISRGKRERPYSRACARKSAISRPSTTWLHFGGGGILIAGIEDIRDSRLREGPYAPLPSPKPSARRMDQARLERGFGVRHPDSNRKALADQSGQGAVEVGGGHQANLGRDDFRLGSRCLEAPLLLGVCFGRALGAVRKRPDETPGWRSRRARAHRVPGFASPDWTLADSGERFGQPPL